MAYYCSQDLGRMAGRSGQRPLGAGHQDQPEPSAEASFPSPGNTARPRPPTSPAESICPSLRAPLRATKRPLGSGNDPGFSAPARLRCAGLESAAPGEPASWIGAGRPAANSNQASGSHDWPFLSTGEDPGSATTSASRKRRTTWKPGRRWWRQWAPWRR